MHRARTRAVRRLTDEERPHPAPVARDAPISNRMVVSLVGSTRGGGAEVGDDIAPTPPSASAAVSPTVSAGESFEVMIESELEGHGNGPGQTVPANPTASEPSPVPGGVDVDVEFQANEPSEDYKPAADIAAAHGQPDAVGWTTPSYNIRARSGGTASRAVVDVTLDFAIELAEEYEGETLEVLRDHELGHVNLGTMAGEVTLDQGLETQLESLPALTNIALEGTVRSVANAFEFWESIFSWLYDRIDYPRMREAYLGARMTLEELEGLSPTVERMSGALRDFALADEDAVSDAADEVMAARGGLSDLDLARVQYNGEFEELVWGADDQIAASLQALEEESRLESKLRRVSSMLGDFTWKVPAAG